MYGDVYEPEEPGPECRDCGGSGGGPDPTTKCRRCDGTGTEPEPEYPSELE